MKRKEMRERTSARRSWIRGPFGRLTVFAGSLVLVLLLFTATVTALSDLGSDLGPEPMEEPEASPTAGIVEQPGQDLIVHRAASENTSANSTYLDHPLANGNPDAVLFVTQVLNPGGSEETNNNHAIGVRYDPDAKRWAVINQDGAEIPLGASFNVIVVSSLPSQSGQ